MLVSKYHVTVEYQACSLNMMILTIITKFNIVTRVYTRPVFIHVRLYSIMTEYILRYLVLPSDQSPFPVSR